MDLVKRSIIELNLSLIIMGGTTVFPKLINLPVNYIIFGRSIVAALTILLYIKISKYSLSIKFDKNFPIVLISGVFLGFHWVSLFEAIKLSTVSIGILSFFTYPIITVFLEKLFLRSQIAFMDIILGVLVLIGLSLVFQNMQISSQYALGSFWGVISAILFSLRMIISKRLLSVYTGEETMFYQVIVAAICLSPLIFFNHISISCISIGSIGGLILLGAVFTALPHTLLIRSLSGLKPKTVGILSSLQPLYCILVAFIVLKEIPSISVAIGGIIIISTVVSETIRNSKC